MSVVALRQGLNGDFYTLDSGNNRVFVHETEDDYLTFAEPNPQEALFGGQAVGTHIIGRMIDMVWRPSGSQVANEGIAVLDGRGALLTYHPGFSNVRAVPLGLASEWKTPVAIAQFNERLYVLDRGAGQIWRYFPEGDGFIVDEGQRALTLPDLQSAVDFTIYSEDGSVIVLYEDGRLRRYGQDSLLWDETHLNASGLATPLVAPVAYDRWSTAHWAPRFGLDRPGLDAVRRAIGRRRSLRPARGPCPSAGPVSSVPCLSFISCTITERAS